ncbi:hypothetical protein T484DRAFT_1816093 [Baffinella frigidus]|nr:hypothetical protein T484DRAFT_1816093 [Cryptophyta sp. CCMP2293]
MCTAQVPSICAGCCSRPPNVLVGLRGGSSADSSSLDDSYTQRCALGLRSRATPWREARKEGDAHDDAGEWASAIACYTRGLAFDSTPPVGAAILYSKRALALLKQGSFVKAGKDARSGLAVGGWTALEFMQQFISIARDADLGVALEQRRAAAKRGDALHQAAEWASAIANYTRGLACDVTTRGVACDATPPGGAALLYFNDAVALLEEGSSNARALLSETSGLQSRYMTEETVLLITRQLLSTVDHAAAKSCHRALG